MKREGVLPFKKTIELAIGILRGLEFLHSRKIIHRDIKPANILLHADTPRLTDFGMSRVITENSLSGAVYGTPYYMAPEAFSRKRNVQTDLWSFGVVLYKMLSGKLPFPGTTVGELYGSIFSNPPLPLSENIPFQLRNIVMKALEKSPEKRYAKAAEMREDLTNCLALDFNSRKIFSDSLDSYSFQSVTNNPNAVSTTPKNLNIHVTNENSQIESTASYSTKFRRRIFNYKLLTPIALIVVVMFASGFYYFSNLQPIPFRKGDKFGFSTWTKRLVIGAKYDFVSPFSQDLAVVALGQKNADGKFIGKYGFIDKQGREIIPLEYDYAESFVGNLAKVGRFETATNQNKFGFINQKGEVTIPLNYEDATSFSDDFAAVKFQNKWGVIDKTGTPIIAFKYDSIEKFSDDLAAVKLGDKYGFIDKSGNQILPFDYDFAENFSDGIAPVMKDGKAFFIDSKGNEAIRFKYNHTNIFSEGFAMVTLNGKSGFIEKSGNEIIPFQYENEKSVFSEGLACVKLNGKTGFIDKTGKITIPFIYAEAEPIHNNLARVKNVNGKEFYIGFDGREFYEP